LFASVSFAFAGSGHYCNHGGQGHGAHQSCSHFKDVNNDGICDVCEEGIGHHGDEGGHHGDEDDHHGDEGGHHGDEGGHQE
jgi:hypothetical protein